MIFFSSGMSSHHSQYTWQILMKHTNVLICENNKCDSEGREYIFTGGNAVNITSSIRMPLQVSTWSLWLAKYQSPSYLPAHPNWALLGFRKNGRFTIRFNKRHLKMIFLSLLMGLSQFNFLARHSARSSTTNSHTLHGALLVWSSELSLRDTRAPCHTSRAHLPLITKEKRKVLTTARAGEEGSLYKVTQREWLLVCRLPFSEFWNAIYGLYLITIKSTWISYLL